MNRTCLSYWFPLIQAAGLPVPRTEIVRTDVELIRLFTVEQPKGMQQFIADLEAAARRIGTPPYFLRTGQGSGKHNWKETCYLADLSKLRDHVVNLTEWSEMVDFMGLATDVWVVREMLATVPDGFCPRYGDMPVCREFRFFVDGPQVLCSHPYWPSDSLVQGGFPLTEAWHERFCQLPEGHDLHALASAAGTAVGGRWSVDLLETTKGWFLTDMAETDRSFHWPDCPNGPKQKGS